MEYYETWTIMTFRVLSDIETSGYCIWRYRGGIGMYKRASAPQWKAFRWWGDEGPDIVCWLGYIFLRNRLRQNISSCMRHWPLNDQVLGQNKKTFKIVWKVHASKIEKTYKYLNKTQTPLHLELIEGVTTFTHPSPPLCSTDLSGILLSFCSSITPLHGLVIYTDGL